MKVEIILIPVGPDSLMPAPSAPGPPVEMLWHYTTRHKLEQILATGMIQPSTAHIERAEKPVAWFSSRPTWEPTATKCPLTGKLGQIVTASAQGGLVRIAVPAIAAPHGFPQLPLLAGTSPRMCIGLVLAGLEVGADPNDWFFSLKPVPRDLWRAIEVYDFENDRWSDAGVLPVSPNPGFAAAGQGSSGAPQAGSGGPAKPLSPAVKSVLEYLGRPRTSGQADLGRPSLN